MKEYKGFMVDDDLNIYNARTGKHKLARVLKGELRKDYLGYLFSYMEGQTTIESAS